MARRFKGKPGDLLEIFRGSYQHWAVYIGGQEVVHLVTEGGDSSCSLELLSSRAEVKREKLTDVVGNDRYQVNNLLDDSRTAREPNVIVKEAFEMVDHKLLYHLYNKNSADFATEMRYGKAESCQFNGKPGDLIQIFCGHYLHWAVYIGENEVVHFTTDSGQSSGSFKSLSSSTGRVKCEKLTDVVGNDRFKVNNLLDDLYDARDPSIIVKEASAMVGRKLQYDLDNTNAEHFATEMRYGKAESRQFKGNKGDLIEIFRGSYKQWAVYIGGMEVVHLVPEGVQSSGSFASLSSRAEVKREKLTNVVGHHRFKVNNLLDDRRKAREPNVIVKEACEMVDHKLLYNLDNKNSEDFATEMRYGKAESCQFNGKPGDLIQIFCGHYLHWAVYIGENEVVHFTTDSGQSSDSFKSLSSSTGTVKCEKLTDVVGNDRFKVNNLLDDMYDARDPSIIVKKASAMVGRKLQYDLDNTNAEHFATEMRYGKAESRQFKGNKGDLIEIFRGSYKQWAVYIGGMEVVHLVRKGVQSSGSFASLSSRAEVKREKLTNVVGHHRFKVNNLLDDRRKAREPNVIVKEARAMVDHKLLYNLDNKNSEDFATEMRYGKAESCQFKGKPGDLIEINRGLYKDWAVYIREDEVVHFTTEGGQSSGSSESLSSSTGKVKCEKFTDVVGNHRYQVNNLLDDLYDARDPSMMVKEASAMVGRKLQYDLDKYNCEHFATEMRYGKAESRQFKGKPGDLIEIFRGSYKHWAVYIGKDEVVHFGTDSGGSSGLFKSLSRSAGTVKREKLADVVGHHRCKVNNLLDDLYDARDPSIIVKEACALVSHKLWYSVVTFNCEHFATEMRYGKAVSQQRKFTNDAPVTQRD